MLILVGKLSDIMLSDVMLRGTMLRDTILRNVKLGVIMLSDVIPYESTYPCVVTERYFAELNLVNVPKIPTSEIRIVTLNFREHSLIKIRFPVSSNLPFLNSTQL